MRFVVFLAVLITVCGNITIETHAESCPAGGENYMYQSFEEPFDRRTYSLSNSSSITLSLSNEEDDDDQDDGMEHDNRGCSRSANWQSVRASAGESLLALDDDEFTVWESHHPRLHFLLVKISPYAHVCGVKVKWPPTDDNFVAVVYGKKSRDSNADIIARFRPVSGKTQLIPADITGMMWIGIQAPAKGDHGVEHFRLVEFNVLTDGMAMHPMAMNMDMQGDPDGYVTAGLTVNLMFDNGKTKFRTGLDMMATEEGLVAKPSRNETGMNGDEPGMDGDEPGMGGNATCDDDSAKRTEKTSVKVRYGESCDPQLENCEDEGDDDDDDDDDEDEDGIDKFRLMVDNVVQRGQTVNGLMSTLHIMLPQHDIRMGRIEQCLDWVGDAAERHCYCPIVKDCQQLDVEGHPDRVFHHVSVNINCHCTEEPEPAMSPKEKLKAKQKHELGSDCMVMNIKELFTCSGQCVYGYPDENGECVCDDSHWGSTCSNPCPCKSRGGKCTPTGGCSCHHNSDKGYWQGDYCGYCAAGWSGIGCLSKVTTDEGAHCSGLVHEDRYKVRASAPNTQLAFDEDFSSCWESKDVTNMHFFVVNIPTTEDVCMIRIKWGPNQASVPFTVYAKRTLQASAQTLAKLDTTHGEMQQIPVDTGGPVEWIGVKVDPQDAQSIGIAEFEILGAVSMQPMKRKIQLLNVVTLDPLLDDTEDVVDDLQYDFEDDWKCGKGSVYGDLDGSCECRTGYWGNLCQFKCACNGNGECNQVTGECHCHQSTLLGYWASPYCNWCIEGYTGDHCNVVTSQRTPSVPEHKCSTVVNMDWNQNTVQGTGKGLFKLFDKDPTTTWISKTSTIPQRSGYHYFQHDVNPATKICGIQVLWYSQLEVPVQLYSVKNGQHVFVTEFVSTPAIVQTIPVGVSGVEGIGIRVETHAAAEIEIAEFSLLAEGGKHH